MQHVIFIIDDARLEAQAILLMASLSRFSGRSVKLIAYVPTARITDLSAPTHAMAAACRVDLRCFDVAPDFWAKPYPHGNKIIACADAERLAGPDVSRITFLDSDMLAMADLAAAFPANDLVLAVPEGVRSWGADEREWHRAYGFFGLELPTRRVTLTRGRFLSVLPYFNAGLVSFPGTGGRPGFAAHWLETARAFDACPIADKRPWLDQITLPLTLARYGHDWESLPKTFNYSLSDRASDWLPKSVKMVHYHRAGNLERFPAVLEQAMLTAMEKLGMEQRLDLLHFVETHLGLGLSAAEP